MKQMLPIYPEPSPNYFPNSDVTTAFALFQQTHVDYPPPPSVVPRGASSKTAPSRSHAKTAHAPRSALCASSAASTSTSTSSAGRSAAARSSSSFQQLRRARARGHGQHASHWKVRRVELREGRVDVERVT